jgi:hypothetical protein
MNNLTLFVANKLMSYCEKRSKTLRITGTGGPQDVYLIRYYVIKSKYFNFFIHQFLRSDRDDLHDHPWDFCTYLVRGAYTEKKFNPQTKEVELTRRQSGANSLIFTRTSGNSTRLMDDIKTYPVAKNRFVWRKATDQHQVLTDHSYRLNEKEFAPLTFCFTGRTKRDWGFIKTLNDGVAINGNIVKPNTRRWVDWREYLGLPSDTPGRG